MGAISHRRLSPCCVPVGWWDCLQDLSFQWPQHESEYMAIHAARARSCSILQRLLASNLTALFCGKEIYTMYRHHVTPRRALLMVLNGASAVLLCLGARALLRERRLNIHERLKCFLHVLIALTSQENTLLAGGKELSFVAASPLLLHAVESACMLVDGLRLRALLYLQALFLGSLAFQVAGAILRGDHALFWALDCAACLAVTGLTVALKARTEKASRLAFLQARGLPADLLPGLYRCIMG